ncbi:MAG TPA: STAS domain-containing protein [Actinomycetota bacterium]|nr:STAS domain-containing protein [Actinomycetota bacterium]
MTMDDRPDGWRGPDPIAARPPPDPTAAILELSGQLDRADIAAFCERARTAIWRSDAAMVVCDLGRLGRPDAVTVDALARLQLEARRLGRRIVFRDACGELRDLVAFVGLDEALPCEGG